MIGTTTPSSTGTPCAASAVNCPPGGTASMERTRYFARQLLTPDDLMQEQEYFRARLRRHNRLLHGWGVVCGCEVKATSTDWTVVVEPGYALAPQGDEILIDAEVTVDLSRQSLDGNAAIGCTDDTDPWCSNVRVDRKAGDKLYLAVAYQECMSRPVRVQPAGCGCDGGQCEYSRIRDSFILRVLTQLPASYADIMQPPKLTLDCVNGIRPCPPCVTDPWVVLATITLSGKTVHDSDIDNVSARRYALSFADWWYKCSIGVVSPGIEGSTPTPAPGNTP